MNIFDFIVNEHAGKEERHLLHVILENQYFFNQNQKKIMNQLDQLKTALAAESVSVETLAKAYSDLVTKLNNLPPDDTEALKALTDEANADIARIAGVLNPAPAPTPDPVPDPTPAPDPVPDPTPEPEPTADAPVE